MSAPNSRPPIASRAALELQAEIERCSNLRDRQILRARLASNLARMSDFAKAREIVRQLRDENSGYEPLLASWIMYCEGLLHQFETFDIRRAYDRFRRANIFAAALKDSMLAGATSAWMAHYHFIHAEMEQTADQLMAAFKWSQPNHGDTLARASLVLADALCWSGEEMLARKWYKRAREHAVRDGDISMQNAMFFNSASFRVASLTIKDCQGNLDRTEFSLAKAEVEAATTLNQLIANASLPTFLPLLNAEMLLLEKEWVKAANLFDHFIDPALKEGHSRDLPRLLIQCAWCKANLGQIEAAKRLYEESLAEVDQCNELDEVAIVHMRAAQIAQVTQDTAEYSKQMSAGQFAANAFLGQQASARQYLAKVLAVADGK